MFGLRWTVVVTSAWLPLEDPSLQSNSSTYAVVEPEQADSVSFKISDYS